MVGLSGRRRPRFPAALSTRRQQTGGQGSRAKACRDATAPVRPRHASLARFGLPGCWGVWGWGSVIIEDIDRAESTGTSACCAESWADGPRSRLVSESANSPSVENLDVGTDEDSSLIPNSTLGISYSWIGRSVPRARPWGRRGRQDDTQARGRGCLPRNGGCAGS